MKQPTRFAIIIAATLASFAVQPLVQSAWPTVETGVDQSSSVVTITFKPDAEADDAHGSGVILANGTILTARHVTHDEKSVFVVMPDGRETPAKVLWEDEAHDVALIQPEIVYVTGPALDCAVQKIGTRIEAVGSPLDLGSNIHSWGHIASGEQSFSDWKAAQVVDLTIAPGSSGGPAFNERGKVVGITVGAPIASLGSFPAITGYSIIVPASAICPLIDQHHRVSAPGV